MNIIAYLFSHLALTEVHSFRRRNGVSCVTSVVSKHSVEFKIPKANQHVDRHKLSMKIMRRSISRPFISLWSGRNMDVRPL